MKRILVLMLVAASLVSQEVAPNEDLMREHGLLNRLLLIYQEIANRIDNHEQFPKNSLKDSVKIARDFLENYHEKLEEEYIFPRFEKAQQQLELVKTLKEQHQAGRQITDYLLQHADDQDEIGKMVLADYLRLYIRIFRPHEAREDTILFPEFRKLVTNEEYERLGDLFEEREEQLFGKNGFESMVNKVESIEKALNIYNLSQFTPSLKQ